MTHVQNSKSNDFVIATETGILYKMKQQNPTKNFIPASTKAECEFMKMITLEKVYDSLLNEKYEVKVYCVLGKIIINIYFVLRSRLFF